eukprot:TCONS_00038423-protein
MIQKKKIVTLILLIYFLPCRSENSTHRSRFSSLKNNNKRRFCSPIRLYANHCATFQLNISGTNILLSGDVETNPGPSLCSLCSKTVRKNSKTVSCYRCQQKSHLSCVDPKKKASITEWMCQQCLPSVLPFCNVRDLSQLDQEIAQQQHQDLHLEKLKQNKHLLSIAHLNTQSMVSTFDEFMLFVDRYDFDVITLTETWLKDNPFLLDYVKIDGYEMHFHNRD